MGNEKLQPGVIVDSALNLDQALKLRQIEEPPQEILDRLGLLDVQYYSFDGNLHQGQVLMDKRLLDEVRGAFKLIKALRFPVFSVRPVMDRQLMDEEEKATTLNNSCAFSYRLAFGKDTPSNHGLGIAIDINPVQNPYINEAKGLRHPPDAEYDPSAPGTLTADSEIVKYFKDRGWEWGGDWTDRKDYMHFQRTENLDRLNVFEVGIDRSLPKEEYFEKLLEGVDPDAFFVLGGGNKKLIDEQKRIKGYKTSPYKGLNYPRYTGGAKARPLAVLELSKFYPGAKIVTMSHRPEEYAQMEAQRTFPKDMPPFAQILDEELQRWGENGEIIEIPSSTSTLTEMMEIIKMSAENNWVHPAVVTNDYQIERAQRLVDMLLEPEGRLIIRNQVQFLFKSGEETDVFNRKWAELEKAVARFIELGAKISFVQAEAVLKRRSPHYEALVNRLTEENGYRAVVEHEREGNDDIEQGKYNFAQDNFKEYILYD